MTVGVVVKTDQVFLSGDEVEPAGGAVAPSGDVEGFARLGAGLVQLSLVCA